MPLASPISLALLVVSVAFWFGFRAFSNRSAPRDTARFVAVAGRITGCWKDELERPDDPPPGDLWVTFEYDWLGDRLRGDDCVDSAEEAGAIAAGSDRPLWVDPAHPDRAQLSDPSDPKPEPLLSLPLLFLIVTTWLILLFFAGLAGLGG